MAKKNKTAPDIINNVRLCDSCTNCVTLNTKKQTLKTEHFSDGEYSWDSFNEPICKILAVQLNNVKKCSGYKAINPKSIN